VPYESLDNKEATLTLRVMGPKAFRVVDGFRYRDQYDGMETYTVPAGLDTDLASVPFFLQWMVRSYGKHTMAAIVHDEYWDATKSPAELRKANTAFRHAMWESDIVLSWSVPTWVALGSCVPAGVAVVASAVGSKAIARLCRKVLIGLAVLLPVVALFSFLGHNEWVADHGWLVALGALAVGLAAWGRLIAAGFFATLEVAIILVPVLGIVLGLLLYVALEMVMLGLLKVGRAIKGVAGRKPVGTLNPVVSDNLEAPRPSADVTWEASQI